MFRNIYWGDIGDLFSYLLNPLQFNFLTRLSLFLTDSRRFSRLVPRMKGHFLEARLSKVDPYSKIFANNKWWLHWKVWILKEAVSGHGKAVPFCQNVFNMRSETHKIGLIIHSEFLHWEGREFWEFSTTEILMLGGYWIYSSGDEKTRGWAR